MKYIVKTDIIEIPKDVEVNVHSRIITVKGKRGSVTKNLKHLKVEIISKTETDPTTKQQKKVIELSTFMTTYKQSAILYTVAAHIKNMIKGVTKGFRYKMHIVKKHFPIEIAIKKDCLEIGRFLGERNLKIVKLLDGVSVTKNEKNAEELFFDGTDIDKVSLTCAHVYQSCAVQGKDKRKFLDGIYVNEKGTIDK